MKVLSSPPRTQRVLVLEASVGKRHVLQTLLSFVPLALGIIGVTVSGLIEERIKISTPIASMGQKARTQRLRAPGSILET